MSKKIRSKKYFTAACLLNLSVNDVYKHVQKLYQHIAVQNKKIKKLQLKIKKMKFLSKLDAHLMKSQQEAKSTDSTQKDPAKIDDTADKKNEENVNEFVNEIKNAAMMNTYEQAGFIYEPVSGLYWDSKSGYYYNPQCDLYYNGNDGCWYRLNPVTNEFIFHSATEASKAAKKSEKDEEEAIRKILDEGRQQPTKSVKSKDNDSDYDRRARRYSSSNSSSSDDSYRRRRSRSRNRSHRRRRSRSRSRSRGVKEDGELASTDSEDTRREAEYRNFQKKRKKKKKGNEYEEIAKKYPPSLRLIVTESKVSKIQVGKLFMVPFKGGGTLGREGSHHHVLLPVEDVSKEHLKFTYNNKKGIYQFIDKSRNGTLLNGKQVSLLKQEECEPQALLHGDTLEIGRVKLLAHIHEGLNTCNECEPFNYAQQPQEPSVTKSTSDDLLPATLSHKEQLKKLQKRYGLESEKYQEKPSGASNKNYEDRASQRRKKVGSSHENEKTVQASLDTSISSENKGFKMLAKMGWSEGASIGKSDTGIKEPVQVKTQKGTTGLGAATSFSFDGNKKKQEIWSKTQERYNKLKGSDDD